MNWLRRIGYALPINMFWMASSQALAGGGAHGELPVGHLLAQSFNFAIVVILLVFLTRKAVSSHFKSREHDFTAHLHKAQLAHKEAEHKKKEISERLAKLESTAEESLQQARGEAEELKHKIIAEAKSLAERLKRDAERSAEYELERAANQLREKLLNTSIDSATEKLKDSVDGPAQKRLQNEFVEKIQVVS